MTIGYGVKKASKLLNAAAVNVSANRQGPIIDADAPNVVWAIDFQHDSTADGHKFKIASMVDEHTRESLLDITARSITGEDLVRALKLIIAVRGLPVLIRCDNGPELVSDALREFCEELIGIGYIPPGEPWRNGFIESFNNRVRGTPPRGSCLRPSTMATDSHANWISSRVSAQPGPQGPAFLLL